VETRKLTLDTAVNLREKLDRIIHENYQTLISCNSVDIRNEKECNIRELLRFTESAEIQVIRLKEAIQQANLKRHPFESKSNAYYIYRLSQLKARHIALLKMSTKNGQTGRRTFKAEIKEKEADEMIRDINDKIDKISQKLSRFNTLKRNTIKIKFEEDLLYLLD
jgi:hypothetical protein